MTTLQIPESAYGTGRIVWPGEPGWDEARATFNMLIDQRPEAIAFPRTAAEVAAVVGLAHERGLQIAVQATGHNAGPLGSLEGTLLVNTSALTGVSIDADARRARVGAATRWRDIVPALSELGLAALHGSSPDVGIVGYSLGGGIGWLSRTHGMQTNAVTAIELVTADGELRRTDAENEPDLFWALRGGNGNFGIVTAIEFEVFPLTEITSGALFYPIEQAGDVLTTWTALLPTLPEELMSWANIIHFPPIPDVPEVFRGRSLAVVMAAHQGTEAEARELLAPLFRLAPELDTLALGSPLALADLAMDPRDPLPFRTAHALVDEVPATVIADLARTANEGSTLTLVQLRHMGGALGRPAPGAGARDSLPGQVSVLALGVVPFAEAEPAVTAELGAIEDAFAPYRAGDYPNFVEEPADTSGFFGRDAWERLRRVKAQYDAGDLLRGNHHIPPARHS